MSESLSVDPPRGALPAPLPALTGEQREAVLETARQNRTLGTAAIMRKAGIAGSRGQLHGLLDDDLKAEIREARGWNVQVAEDVLYQVAIDPDHPQWARAIQLFLKAQAGPEYRDELRRLEHTGKDGGPIQLIAGQFNPDLLTADELEELRALLEKARRDDDDGTIGVVAQLPRR